MKSIVCVLLVFSMLLCITACGDEQAKPTPDETQKATTTAATEPSAQQTGAVTTRATTAATTTTAAVTTTTELTTTTTDPNNSIVITGEFYVSDSAGTRWVEDVDVVSAEAMWQENENTGIKSPILVITLTDDGAQKLKTATEANLNKLLYMWVGDMLLATPVFSEVVEDGVITVTFNGWDDDSFRDIQKIAEAITA